MLKLNSAQKVKKDSRSISSLMEAKQKKNTSHSQFPFLVERLTSNSSNDTAASLSTSSENGLTTLELHPNVVLGLGQDDDELSQHTELINRPHLCTICHATYKTRTHLRRHMFVHMTSRPFPCPAECGKGFNRREHLNKHMETVHRGQKHSCPYCHKEISRLDHLRNHIKNLHINKVSKSSKGPVLKVQMSCGQKQRAEIAFMTPQNSSGTMGETIITSIPKDPLEKDVEKASSTNVHIDSNHASSSSSSPSMTINPSNILGQCKGIATISVQSTPTQKVLVHQRLPPGSEVNVNSATGLASLANLNLTTLGGGRESQVNVSGLHKTEDKKVSLRNYACEHCTYTFNSAKDLEIHAKSHKAQHKCPDCPRAYTRKEKLAEHIRCVHEGLKFSCEYCGKKLSRKDHVLRHIRSIHPEVYAAGFADLDDSFITLDDDGKFVASRNAFPLISPSAGKKKKLAIADPLSMHSIGDVGVLLRSVCQICFKVFGTQYHRTRHIESCHSGDVRPFSCTACNKQFKRKDHLVKHVKSHCPSLKEETFNSSQSSQHQLDRNSKDVTAVPYSSCSEDPVSSVRSNSSNNQLQNLSVLENLQVGMTSDVGIRNGENPGIMLQNHGETNVASETSLIVDDTQQNRHSDSSTEFGFGVIDSFMQGNVNVIYSSSVLPNEHISSDISFVDF